MRSKESIEKMVIDFKKLNLKFKAIDIPNDGVTIYMYGAEQDIVKMDELIPEEALNLDDFIINCKRLNLSVYAEKTSYIGKSMAEDINRLAGLGKMLGDENIMSAILYLMNPDKNYYDLNDNDLEIMWDYIEMVLYDDLMIRYGCFV